MEHVIVQDIPAEWALDPIKKEASFTMGASRFVVNHYNTLL